MSEMDTPSIILVGGGRFGSNHLRVWKELENDGFCRLSGVVDPRLDVLEKVQKTFNVKVSKDLADFPLNDVDAVDIVTPTDTHFKLGAECLCAGKHVLIEKPLTANSADAEALVRMSKEQKKILMVGHIFRYNQAVNKIKQYIESGDLGKVYYMFGHFMGIKDPRNDVGALYNYAVHHVDASNYLLNDFPDEVTCNTGYFLGRSEFEDVAFLTLKYPSGILTHVEGSWLPPGKSRDMTVVGSKKSVASDLLAQTLTLYGNHMEVRDGQFRAVDQEGVGIQLGFEEPLKLELLDFVKSISTGRQPNASGQSGLDVVRVMDAALRSARLGRTVSVN